MYTYIYIYMYIYWHLASQNDEIEDVQHGSHMAVMFPTNFERPGCRSREPQRFAFFGQFMSSPGEVIGNSTIGKPWENGGLMRFDGILWDVPSGNLLHS